MVDQVLLLPDIPINEQWRWSLGTGYDLNETATIGASYTLLWTGDMDVDNVSLPPSGSVVLDGDYNDAFLHIFGMRLNVRF